MLLAKVLCLCQAYAFAQAVSFMPSSRSLKFDRFDGMGRGKNVPIRISFSVIKTEAAAIYLNSTAHVAEDLTSAEPMMHMAVVRCRSKENLDTCEDFLKPKPSSYCMTLAKMNPMGLDYNPSYTCPIKKGTYKAYNHKMDLSPVMVFPLNDWYWKAIITTKDAKTGRVLYIFEAAVYLVKRN